jgi:hypothetical protein
LNTAVQFSIFSITRGSFGRQKLFFPRKPPAIAGQLSVLAYDAVARNDDRNWIARAGTSDRADRFWLSECPGHLGIAAGCSARNALQF